jgi:hypothetical protein
VSLAERQQCWCREWCGLVGDGEDRDWESTEYHTAPASLSVEWGFSKGPFIMLGNSLPRACLLVGGIRVRAQSLMLTRQSLYHLRHALIWEVSFWSSF